MTKNPEHWLERRLGGLEELCLRYAGVAAQRPDGDEGAEGRRVELVREFEAVVGEIAARDGITAAIASHDGLLLAKAGDIPDFEALAAVAQVVVAAVHSGASTMSLGPPQQIVTIGDEHKLVLFSVGGIVIAVLSPRSVALAAALAA